MRILRLLFVFVVTGCASTDKKTAEAPAETKQETILSEAVFAKEGAQLPKATVTKPYMVELENLLRKGVAASAEDYQRLRVSYAHSDGYQPYLNPEYAYIESAFASMNEENWSQCVGYASRAIDVNYTNLNGQYLSMVCNFELGNVGLGEQHKLALDGFIEAIWSTGDGKSETTAFHTYTTDELRAFIHLHGLEIISQSLLHGDNGVYDLMDVKNPETNEQTELYFNITHQFSSGLAGLED
ncbi:DUF4919 domain-containing protein [Thalassotalea sp. PS06]|uniref:DUF4919 domain-containing protein n=1 Tax=Thalassotalea sp. PS06 TaxID=2594005 RepID=UPI00163DCFAF|nr:DUF4919 domain-containing protein [Thalassotalea sp. PS06]